MSKCFSQDPPCRCAALIFFCSSRAIQCDSGSCVPDRLPLATERSVTRSICPTFAWVWRQAPRPLVPQSSIPNLVSATSAALKYVRGWPGSKHEHSLFESCVVHDSLNLGLCMETLLGYVVFVKPSHACLYTNCVPCRVAGGLKRLR